MSFCERRHILLAPLSALALTACGFTPVYGPGGTGTRLQDRVRVTAPEDRDTFLLVRRLEERLGRAPDPDYSLALNLQTRAEGFGIDADGNTDRVNLIGIAGYVLTDAAGTEVTSGTVNGFTGYSATGITTAALAAERDARTRLMVMLADQIVTRLFAAPLPASLPAPRPA